MCVCVIFAVSAAAAGTVCERNKNLLGKHKEGKARQKKSTNDMQNQTKLFMIMLSGQKSPNDFFLSSY